MAGALAGNKSARHAATTRNRLRVNVYPILGSHPIAEIEPTELVELAKGIETRGASDMAKRILQIVGMVLRYAVAHGYSKRNPASEIRPSDILKPTAKRTWPASTPRSCLPFCGQLNCTKGRI